MIYVPLLSPLTRVLFIKSLYSCSAQTNGQHLIKAVTVFTEVTVGVVVVVRNAAKIYIRERRGRRRRRGVNFGHPCCHIKKRHCGRHVHSCLLSTCVWEFVLVLPRVCVCVCVVP